VGGAIKEKTGGIGDKGRGGDAACWGVEKEKNNGRRAGLGEPLTKSQKRISRLGVQWKGPKEECYRGNMERKGKTRLRTGIKRGGFWSLQEGERGQVGENKTRLDKNQLN